MRAWAVIPAMAIAIAGCASDDATTVGADSTAATAASASERATCPVADEAFCTTASMAVAALASRDASALADLSIIDTINCADVAREYFPGCETDDVLEGHGVSDADLTVDALDTDAYNAHLEALLARMDESFADALGSGAPRIIGVGTCGPDDPNRRTYHLAWTAALAREGGPSRRALGSFEFGFRDGDWRIVLTYADALEAWERRLDDPLRDAFCEAGRTPWS